MIFAPTAIIWTIFWIAKEKNYRIIFPLIISAIWALGLSAFFTFPILVEQKEAHVESLVIGYFNYLAHFANLDQLFISNFWGYGGSFLGVEVCFEFSGLLVFIQNGLVVKELNFENRFYL